jgi:L-amino acid N-acyltransferase YncA
MCAKANPEMIIRPATPDDHQAVMDIYNRIHHDTLPVSLEDYRAYLADRERDVRIETWVADQNGKIVGSFDVAEQWTAREPGVFMVYLEVGEGHRGHGIGRKLYAHLLERARELGVRRFYTQIREDDARSMAFAEARGLKPNGLAERSSRLKVHDARLVDFAGAEEQLASQGIIIRTLAEIGTDDETFMRALHSMSEAASCDVPLPEPFDPRPFEYWVEHVLGFPGNSPEWCWVATHDRKPVGIARLRVQGNAAGNAFTGVAREYRGRGIARGLKLRSVLWARDNGVEYIYTGNDVANPRMLDINMRMGYELLPGTIEMQKDF